MLLVLVILLAAVSAAVPNFLSWVNLTGLALSVSTVGILSCTMLFCLAAGDFDLSVGSVVAFAGVVAAALTNATGSVAAGIAAGMLAGGSVGLVNGVVVAGLGVNALIATLASMQVVRGFCYIASDGKAIGVRETGFFALGITSLLGVPTPVWIMLSFFVVFGLLLNRTVFGRNAP